MPSITFHCRTISPMFIGGADPDIAELRPPSLKGALRFWWRAMNAHLVENGDCDRLREKESEIFGDTTRRSSVEVDCLLTKPNYLKEKLKGDLLYMAYGAEQRKALGVDAEFQVTLSSKNNLHFEEAKKAFSLLTHLGGLGAKSRNGFGAFVCEQAYSFEKICHYDCFKNNASMNSPYTAIGNEAQIYVSEKPKKDWEQAIKKLKKIYADNAKKRIFPKEDRIYVAAPYKDKKPPERHAKIHIMSLTVIKDELHYTITFLPYSYMAMYGDSQIPNKNFYNKWREVVTGKEGFNQKIVDAMEI